LKFRNEGVHFIPFSRPVHKFMFETTPSGVEEKLSLKSKISGNVIFCSQKMITD